MAKPPRGGKVAGASRLRYLAFLSSAVLAALVVTAPGRGGLFSGELRRDGEGPPRRRALTPEEAAAAAKAAKLEEEAAIAQLTGRAACVARAVSDPVPMSLWLEKAGPLPMSLLDGNTTRARHLAYFRWRDKRDPAEHTREIEVDGKPDRVGKPPPLFPYCRILVNHKYRTLYLKAPKTGSTSLLTLLGTCTGSKRDAPTCFQPLEPMASEEEYNRMYSDYFVWTVLRNPWTRAVSSYRMLSRYMKRECKELVGGWNNVCRNVNLMPLLHFDHPECTISKREGEGFAMHHFIPQAPCLKTASGEWAADYIVRMESLHTDMPGVFEEMNARRRPGVPPIDVNATVAQITNVNRVHVACRGGLTQDPAAFSRRSLAAQKPIFIEAPESYCSNAQYYIGPHSHCYDAIRAYYAEDMILFNLPTC